LTTNQPQPAQMRDLDAALQDLAEECASRLHEHIELTMRSVEFPHCVATGIFHPRDCHCEQHEDRSEPISDVWLRLFERGEGAGR
jgi:hypothetical protein